MYKVIICLLLFTPGIGNAFKIGIGGKNRGSSAARLNPSRPNTHSSAGGYHPSQGAYHPQQGGYYPQQSGYRPQQNGYHQTAPGGYHPSQIGGYHQQGGFAPNQMKPSGKGTFRKAVFGGALGAAAGLATFELGKASHSSLAILRSGSEPLRASNGQNYYFDERNHQYKNGYFMCSVPIDDVLKTLQGSSTPVAAADESTNSTAISPEQFFKTVHFKDGSRPKSLTWNCKSDAEICCDTDCCPVQQLRGGNFSDHKRPSWCLGITDAVLLLVI
ncbi:hypothetical protein WUBG_04527 [Wuchereria bancrofti]|uniref:CX domain-containing protein n=1 Tax=Wuchereria bancrofti TaxID=6293 RepID=J9EQW4_WUCBA|nr:hypothetical protein WUBG_04527 [Wuchereria bancrofti]